MLLITVSSVAEASVDAVITSDDDDDDGDDDVQPTTT